MSWSRSSGACAPCWRWWAARDGPRNSAPAMGTEEPLSRFNPKRTMDRSYLPPTWTADELGKRSAIERFFGRLLRVLPLQRPPLGGWSAVTCAVALSFSATIVVALAAHQAGRPDLI